MVQAGGKNTVQSTTDTAPHTTLHPTQSFPHQGFSNTSHAAAQYVSGIEAARRSVIWVWELKRRVRERMRAWIACGVREEVKKGDVVFG